MLRPSTRFFEDLATYSNGLKIQRPENALRTLEPLSTRLFLAGRDEKLYQTLFVGEFVSVFGGFVNLFIDFDHDKME